MCFSMLGRALRHLLLLPICILFGQLRGRTWAETITLSIAGSPLHFLSTAAFLGFLGASLFGDFRTIMQNNVIVTGVIGFFSVFSPIFVGVFVPPVGAFKEKCIRLRY